VAANVVYSHFFLDPISDEELPDVQMTLSFPARSRSILLKQNSPLIVLVIDVFRHREPLCLQKLQCP
jgi:hypothetical protein